MHNKKVSDNIETWMDSSRDLMIQREEYPMLLLTYVEKSDGSQGLMMHRGAEYSTDQVIKILDTFKASIIKSSN